MYVVGLFKEQWQFTYSYIPEEKELPCLCSH